MSLSVIDKYVAKKEKDLLDYAKILEAIITIDDNKMWQKKSEFGVYAKEVISIYAHDYYFQNNDHRDNPIEYSNDNINYVLKSIIEYCKSTDKTSLLKTWKNEIFLTSVIICTACYVDFATNIIDGSIQDTKAKFKYLLKYLSKTKILKIKENKYWINDLFDACKKHNGEDSRVFEIINDKTLFNNYHLIAPKHYTIDFKYNIQGLEEYDEKIKNSVIKDYYPKLLEASYELLYFQILQDLISNKEMNTYFIKVDKTLKKASILNDFSNNYIKPYIKILVPFDEEIAYQGIIRNYKEKGINVIYEYDDEKNVDSKIFDEGIEVLVTDEFMNNNRDNQIFFDKKNIKFVVKNKED